MPWIHYFIRRICLSISTKTRARTTNYSSACSLSEIPWDRSFLLGSYLVRSLIPGLCGFVTMGVYFAVRVPSGLCVATSCVVLFLFRLWEYLYEGHLFLASYGPCLFLPHTGSCFTHPLSPTASLLCQTQSLVRKRTCTTLNVSLKGAGRTGFVQMLFSIFGGVPPRRVIFQ